MCLHTRSSLSIFQIETNDVRHLEQADFHTMLKIIRLSVGVSRARYIGFFVGLFFWLVGWVFCLFCFVLLLFSSFR